MEDTPAVLKMISDALVYGEIAPADADRAVSSRKYKKRLENGTANSSSVISDFPVWAISSKDFPKENL